MGKPYSITYFQTIKQHKHPAQTEIPMQFVSRTMRLIYMQYDNGHSTNPLKSARSTRHFPTEHPYRHQLFLQRKQPENVSKREGPLTF